MRNAARHTPCFVVTLVPPVQHNKCHAIARVATFKSSVECNGVAVFALPRVGTRWSVVGSTATVSVECNGDLANVISLATLLEQSGSSGQQTNHGVLLTFRFSRHRSYSRNIRIVGYSPSLPTTV